MMKVRALAVATGLAFLPAWAEAEVSLVKAGPRAGVTIEVPRTEIQAPTFSAREETPAQFQVFLSSWVPSGFAPPSAAGLGLPAYSASIPYLSLSRLIPLFRTGGTEVALKLGGGFVALSRESEGMGQRAYFFHERIGTEIRKPMGFLGGVVPYASVSLLPVFVIVPRSVFGDGATSMGFAAELNAGVSGRADWLGLGKSDVFAGLMATQGSVKGSGVAGLGLQAGLQFGI